MTLPDDEGYGVLRFGYTVTRLDELARLATKRERWYRALDFDERVQVAFSAIAVELYSATQAPADTDLIYAGMRELSRIASIELAEHGVDVARGRDEAPRFSLYWLDVAGYTPDHAPGIIERMALRQVWPVLSPGCAAALSALAVFDSYPVASVALGIAHKAFTKRIQDGRRQFLKLWHEGEQPSRPWGLDRRRTVMSARDARRNRRYRRKGGERG